MTCTADVKDFEQLVGPNHSLLSMSSLWVVCFCLSCQYFYKFSYKNRYAKHKIATWYEGERNHSRQNEGIPVNPHRQVLVKSHESSATGAWTASSMITGSVVPAKWLCDASSVLVGVWLLVTLRFQPSPLASKLLAAPRKGEQSVSLSLPVYSLSTASPMQYLLVAAGVYGCRKAPELNCKGEISMTQR